MQEFKIDQEVLDILHRLESHGYQAWIVGGALRDLLLGKEPHDFDIATDARPDEVEALFAHSLDYGKKHGTIAVPIHDGKEFVEITTFRKEGTYSDHRRPDCVDFVDDLDQDLARRDFTINAMAYHPQKGLHDPFGGQKDLEKKLIRSVGKAEKRFEEDALRMLRAYRFAGRLGFTIEPETLKAMEPNKPLLKQISKERFVNEMNYILKDSPQILSDMTELLDEIFPVLKQMKKCEQNNVHHYTDVLHHTLDALSYLQEHGWSEKRAWSVLLHDIGKPLSKSHDERGDHFKGHPQISKKMASKLLKEFHFSREFQKDIPLLVLLHDSFYKPSLKNLYKLQVAYGMDEDLIEDLFALQKADIYAHTKHDRLEGLQKFIDYYHQEKDKHPSKLSMLPIDGNDILAHTNLKGPQIYQALERLREIAYTNPQKNNRKDLLALLSKLEKEIQTSSPLKPRTKNSYQKKKGKAEPEKENPEAKQNNLSEQARVKVSEGEKA